jgi:hypothetical protein
MRHLLRRKNKAKPCFEEKVVAEKTCIMPHEQPLDALAAQPNWEEEWQADHAVISYASERERKTYMLTDLLSQPDGISVLRQLVRSNPGLQAMLFDSELKDVPDTTPSTPGSPAPESSTSGSCSTLEQFCLICANLIAEPSHNYIYISRPRGSNSS